MNRVRTAVNNGIAYFYTNKRENKAVVNPVKNTVTIEGDTYRILEDNNGSYFFRDAFIPRIGG